MSLPASLVRFRRRRASESVRHFFEETHVRREDLVLPVFVTDRAKSTPIEPMPGHSQWSLTDLPRFIETACERGIRAILLFGVPSEKDARGSGGYAREGVVPKAIEIAKKVNPALLTIADVCLCEYTSHGHCGIVDSRRQTVDNDRTLPLLAEASAVYAQAGADIVAPSDMMDGRVAAIRERLDRDGFSELAILSYAAKFASCYYGPFRVAAESTPEFGDRRGYQISFANFEEAVQEIEQDLCEGADAVIVKPAGTSLDIIHEARSRTGSPIVAYQVSGEFAQIKAAEARGWLDGRRAMMESLTVIKRAGASRIISYFALEF